MAYKFEDNFISEVANFALSKIGTIAKVYFADGRVLSRTINDKYVTDGSTFITFNLDYDTFGTVNKVEVLDSQSVVLFWDDELEVKDYGKVLNKVYEVKIMQV